MKKMKAVLVGTGARGMGVYANYALSHSNEIEFVAVAEPDEAKRNKFCKLHNEKLAENISSAKEN